MSCFAKKGFSFRFHLEYEILISYNRWQVEVPRGALILNKRGE